MELLVFFSEHKFCIENLELMYFFLTHKVLQQVVFI